MLYPFLSLKLFPVEIDFKVTEEARRLRLVVQDRHNPERLNFQ